MIVTTEGFNRLKEKNPSLKESDCFIVDLGNFAYFVGDHVTDALPDENIAVLQAGMIRGNVANPDGTPYAATGMLSTTGTVEGNTLTVTAYSANNLGELTAEQADTYDAMARMQKKLAGDAQRNEMRNLYSLSPSTAKYALTEIGSSGSEKMVALTQQSTLISRVISDRLSTAFSLRPVE